MSSNIGAIHIVRASFLILLASTLAACSGSSGVRGESIAADPAMVEFLLTAAAREFHTHRPPNPVGFRDVRIGRVANPGGDEQYMLCGEFQPSPEDGATEWTRFATIRTSDYEQWIGTQAAGLCAGSSVSWADGDLSSALQIRLDSLRHAGQSTRADMELTGFGFNNVWLAVKNVEADAIARALDLETVGPCTWNDGVAAAYDYESGQVFITPAIDGWTMCVGGGLIDSFEELRFVGLVTRLAATLNTDVQYFATARVAEAHAWARALPTGLVRAYQFIGERGETTTDTGPSTVEEQELGFRFFNLQSPEAESADYFSRTDLTFPTEEDVMRLAGRWSIDPTQLDGRRIVNTVGTLAKKRDASGR